VPRDLWIDRAISAGVVLAIAFGIGLRVVALDHIPGINGDEAWYGVQMQEWLAGHAPAWRTPTGNPLHPFHSGTVLALLTVFEPRFWILRAPAVLAGVSLIGLTWLGLRRLFDPATAEIGALLAATCPVALVYSRFGWEPSWTPLAALVALLCALQLRGWATGIAFAVALWVHPTNVFLAPILLAPFAADAARHDPRRWRSWVRTGLCALALATAGAARIAIVPTSPVPGTESLWERATSPSEWAAFVGLLGHLLSGITSYRYIVGPVPDFAVRVHELVFWSFFGLCILGGALAHWRRRALRELALLAGFTAMLAGFFLVAGTKSISPHDERYALFCVAPAIVLTALGWRASADLHRRARLARLAALGVGVLALVSVATHYFGAIRATGGRSQQTFHTGPVEPKQAALAEALRRSSASVPTIVTPDWWSYWPIRFLAGGSARVEHPNPRIRTPDLLEATLAEGGAVIGYPDRRFARMLRERSVATLAVDIPTYGGQAALRVWTAAER